MSPQYTYPGVYIEEVTGPGVIAGVGTSTAGFIGPAAAGPMLEPTRLTSLDDFIRVFGSSRNGRPWPYLYVGSTPYYLGFAVEGFFRNGGTQAFITRIGSARAASTTFQNRGGEDAFVISATAEGAAGNAVEAGVQLGASLTIVTGSSALTAAAGTTVQVGTPAPFQVGDTVTTDGANRTTITAIQGSTLTLHDDLGASTGDTLRIADLVKNVVNTFRIESTDGVAAGATLLIGPTPDRVTVTTVDTQSGFISLTPAKNYSVDPNPPALTAVRVLVIPGTIKITGQATTNNPQGVLVSRLTVDRPDLLVPGDTVTSDGTHKGVIDRIQGSDVWLTAPLAGIPAANPKLRLANVASGTTSFRLDRTDGLVPGGILQIAKGANTDYVTIASVTPAGLVTLAPGATMAHSYALSGAASTAPVATPQEVRLVVAPSSSATSVERYERLSLNPVHPRYVLNPGLISSDWVTVGPPGSPPTSTGLPAALAALVPLAALADAGQDDHPDALTSADYQDGLDALRDVDDVNLIVIPDAGSHGQRHVIQQAAIDHCLELADRFAILDSGPALPPFGAGSVEEQRGQVTAERGFAALYYPWLTIADPTATGTVTRTMTIPPSGHLAGVYARTDTERGVHKAPANTDVRGALGLEIMLSDLQQGPLNLEGVNVLRVFPGSASAIVWGARTTVDPDITDWLYVNVRRLLLFIEESVQEGIRWALFEGNDLALWQKLTRTIRAFLTQVWKDGGLFGATADEAFQIRIDEALNPPSERALGRLHIEIQVAPVRPAEFIAVRIGLWDGGGAVTES